MPATLKLWSKSFVEQLTPKASQTNKKSEETNPWDSPNLSNLSNVSPPSPASTHEPITPGATEPLTPSVGGYHHALLGKSPGLGGAQVTASPASPGGAQALPPSLSLQPPSFHAPPAFNMSLPPTKKSQNSTTKPTAESRPPLFRQTTAVPVKDNNSQATAVGPSKGQIHVKLIAARNLNVRSLTARPYVVVVFENNEFVSRDPTGDDAKELKGVATNLSRTSSSNAISALGKAQAQDAARRNASPAPSGASVSSHRSSGSSGSSNGLQLGARMSSTNPVWKHEVSLCASHCHSYRVPRADIDFLALISDVTSEESTIAFNVYDRSEECQTYLGTVQYKPVLIHDHTVDQWFR